MIHAVRSELTRCSNLVSLRNIYPNTVVCNVRIKRVADINIRFNCIGSVFIHGGCDYKIAQVENVFLPTEAILYVRDPNAVSDFYPAAFVRGQRRGKNSLEHGPFNVFKL